jgi:outer membrane protein TolC
MTGSLLNRWIKLTGWCSQIILLALLYPLVCSAEELSLPWLVREALKNNREILALQSRLAAYAHRVPQAGSLPDPMFSVGYQNDGSNEYTYGDSPDAKWMFELSQTFPFAGKRGLQTRMAQADLSAQKDDLESLRRQTVRNVRESYLDLFLAYKSLDLYEEKKALLNRMEEAALARYAAGTAEQTDVILVQTEQYMLMEREEMARQKIQILEGALNGMIGRDVTLPLGRPAMTIKPSTMTGNLVELIERADKNAAEIKNKEKMVAASEFKVGMAKREYFPDVTLNAGYEQRGSAYTDMYSLSASFSVPAYFRSRQEPAVLEASSRLQEAKQDLDGVKLTVAAAIRENFAVVSTADRLLLLYRQGLIPKSTQEYQSALSGYKAGKTGLEAVVAPLKTVLDFELLYWTQLVEREKAMGRIEALTGDGLTGESSPEG